MSAWCTETHGRSGLTAACIASSTTAEEAADDLYAYIRKYVSEPTRGVLAGNCIHCDRDYLRKEPYKKIIDYLHYRIFDVATITGAADRWAPEVLQGLPKRKGLHQAREDVLESIEYARFFRKAFFSKSAESLKDKRLRQDTILSDMVKSQQTCAKTLASTEVAYLQATIMETAGILATMRLWSLIYTICDP